MTPPPDPDPARVRLDPMTDAEYAAFADATLPEYAGAIASEGLADPPEALAQATEQIAQLLPNGRSTPDHRFYVLRAADDGRRVGRLWIAVRQPPKGRGTFVYDLAIEPSERRRGFAGAALRALEEVARAEGSDRIDLHVFGSNEGAVALYRALGYRTTNLRMRLDLPGPPRPHA